MAMTIASFEIFCKNYGNVSDNTRIVLGESEKIVQGDADAGLMGRKVVKGGVSQAEENNRVRTELMSALKNAFGTKLPDSVKKALIGSSLVGGSDMSTGSDGKVNSGRPLTMRRIKAVVAAAKEAIGGQAEDVAPKAVETTAVENVALDPVETEEIENKTLDLLKGTIKKEDNYTNEGDFFHEQGESLTGLSLTDPNDQKKMIAILKQGAEKIGGFLNEHKVDKLSCKTVKAYLSALQEPNDSHVSGLGKLMVVFAEFAPPFADKIGNAILPQLKKAIEELPKDSLVRTVMTAIHDRFGEILGKVDAKKSEGSSENFYKDAFKSIKELLEKLPPVGKSDFEKMSKAILKPVNDVIIDLCKNNLGQLDQKDRVGRKKVRDFEDRFAMMVRRAIIGVSHDGMDPDEAIAEVVYFLKQEGKWKYLKPKNSADYQTEESQSNYLDTLANEIKDLLKKGFASTEIEPFAAYERFDRTPRFLVPATGECVNDDPKSRPHGVTDVTKFPVGVFFGQTDSACTCPFISIMNGMLASGGDNADRIRDAMVIHEPEKEGGYYEFKCGDERGSEIRVNVSDCTDAAFGAQYKRTDGSQFERAVFLAVNKLSSLLGAKKQPYGSDSFDLNTVGLLFGEKDLLPHVDPFLDGIEQKIENALKGKPKKMCVCNYKGHYVAIVEVKKNQSGGTQVGYIESMGDSPKIMHMDVENLHKEGVAVFIQGLNPYKNLS